MNTSIYLSIMFNIMLILFKFIWNLWKLVRIHQKTCLRWLILSLPIVQAIWLVSEWTRKLWARIVKESTLILSISIEIMRIPRSLPLFHMINTTSSITICASLYLRWWMLWWISKLLCWLIRWKLWIWILSL